MKRKLSFYITIKGVTMRLKQASLRTISHVAEQLEDLEDSSNFDIAVTAVTRHYDYGYENADEFVDRVKKAVTYRTAHKKDPLMIDCIIAAIRREFADLIITRNSNAKITVRSRSNAATKFIVFTGVLDEIALRFEANSKLVTIEIDTIDKLLKEIDRVKNPV